MRAVAHLGEGRTPLGPALSAVEVRVWACIGDKGEKKLSNSLTRDILILKEKASTLLPVQSIDRGGGGNAWARTF